jgi:small GTP-binding protein
MKTGIRILDDKIGEIPDNVAVLLSTSPGIDPAPFGINMMDNALKNNLKCVYVVNNKPASAVRREAKTMGLDLSRYEKNNSLCIMDAFSGYMGIHSDEKYVVENPFNPKNILDEIEKIKKRDILFVDSVSSYIDMKESPKELLQMINKLKEKMTVVALFSAWEYEQKIMKEIKDSFDAVLTVKPVEEVTIVRQFLFPEKIGWKKIEKFAVPVKVLKPGGVKVYFPKILVTGPYNAGKSSMVKALSTSAVSVDRMGTTVALDHGYMDYKGFAADLYGTPGQEDFDPILQYLADEAVAVILVVDSTKPETFIRAKEMLSKTKAYGLPIVVAANKQDMDNALSVEDVKKKLALPINVPVYPTVAIEKKGVEKLLDELTEKLMG